MTAYQNLKTRTKVGLGVALPLLLTAVIGAVALISISGLQHTAGWVDHTRKVLARSAEIVSAAVDMETGMRGYLLAGREEFLEPYAQGEARVYTMLDELKVTVSDNPAQVQRLEEVESVLRAWQADVTEMQIALRREIGDADTMNDMARLVGEARGKVFFDRFRGQIAMFIEREQVLLEERRQDFSSKLASDTVSSVETRDAMQWVTHTYLVISEANSLLAAAVDMETGMRGYLLAGRDEFLEPLNAGRTRFFAIATELKSTVSDNPAQVALLTEIEATIQEWLDTIVTPMIALRKDIGDAKTMDDMADLIGQARGKTYFDRFRGLMAEFSAEERRLMVARQAENVDQENFAFLSIYSGLLAAIILGIIAATRIGGSIASPINSVTQAMRRLADGDTAVEIVGQDRADEVGEMAKATQVFKENALRIATLAEEEKAKRAIASQKQEAMASLQKAIGGVVADAAKGEFGQRIDSRFDDAELQALANSVNGLLDLVDTGIRETGRVLARVAQGDLTETMSGDFQGAFAQLQENLNETVSRLSELVSQIAATTQGVQDGAGKITSGAEDLSSRAEQQAASLEETAATMEEMSASVKANAESSKSAISLAADASDRADTGGQIVRNAVAAMNEIETSALKIADIIGVIDSIAFQTNLLALNAAVEAARAGDAGKGFAVVASEVRALAQRASEAASDIRGLIETSASQVATGVKLVTQTGDALETLVKSINQVENAVNDIARASSEQASGAEEISVALSSLDEITQRNSALAGQSVSDAQSLSKISVHLRNILGFFDTRAETPSDGLTSDAVARSQGGEKAA